MFSKSRSPFPTFTPGAISAGLDPHSVRLCERARDAHSNPDAVFLPSSSSEPDDASSSSTSFLPPPLREPASTSPSPVSPNTDDGTLNKAAYTVHDLTQLRRDRLLHRNIRKPSFPAKLSATPRDTHNTRLQPSTCALPAQPNGSTPEVAQPRRHTTVVDTIDLVSRDTGGQDVRSRVQRRGFQGRVDAARKRLSVATSSFGRVAKPVLAVRGAEMETGLSWFGRKVYAVGKGGYGVEDVSKSVPAMGVRSGGLLGLNVTKFGNLNGGSETREGGGSGQGLIQSDGRVGGDLKQLTGRLSVDKERAEDMTKDRDYFATNSGEVASVATTDSHEVATTDSHEVATTDSHEVATSESHEVATLDPHGVATSDTHGVAGELCTVQEREPSFLREESLRRYGGETDGDSDDTNEVREESPLKDIAQWNGRVESFREGEVESSVRSPNKYCVKATCRYGWENSTRCVFVEHSCVFEELKGRLGEAFAMKKAFDVCYKDEDGDIVRMSSESEMTAFKEVVRKQGGRVLVRMVQPNAAAGNIR